jgi:DNA gyrase subunit B
VSQEPVKYDARHIQMLEGWEAIRKRPGMYIGSTGERGLHNLVFEVAGRAVNEVLADRASSVEITLMPDGGVRVADDGPGVHFEDGGDAVGPGLEALLTRMFLGVIPVSRCYPVFSDCGVGLFVANALSSRMVAEVQREGVRWVQEYARGVAVSEPANAGPAAGSGTTITFWPDADIFTTMQCSFDALAERFRELAFLNRNLDVSLTDERHPSEPRSLRFQAPGGVRDMVALLDEQSAGLLHSDIIGLEREDPRMAGTMEVALRWRRSGQQLVRSFANSRPTPGGGTHTAGFHDGVQAAINAYARERRLLTATDPDLGTDRIGEGLTAVVSVKLEYPEFEGSTRGVLGNAAVRACVEQAVLEHLARWLQEHPQQAAAIIDGIIQGARRD